MSFWHTAKMKENLDTSECYAGPFIFCIFPSVAANSKGAHIQYNRFNDPKGDGEIGDGTFGVFMKSFSVSKGLSQESVVSNPSSPVPITAPSPDAVRNCYMGTITK